MLHIGEHIYGVVDQVPGVLHVGTRILHFNYLPVVPLGSVVVVDKKAVGEKTVVKTSLSGKSLFFGYLRFSLMVVGLFLTTFGFAIYDMEKMAVRNPPPWFQSPGLAMMAGGACCLLAWWFSHRLTHASYGRAIQLANQIGLDREYVDENFRIRGLPVGDEPMTTASLWPAAEKDDVYRLE